MPLTSTLPGTEPSVRPATKRSACGTPCRNARGVEEADKGNWACLSAPIVRGLVVWYGQQRRDGQGNTGACWHCYAPRLRAPFRNSNCNYVRVVSNCFVSQTPTHRQILPSSAATAATSLAPRLLFAATLVGGFVCLPRSLAFWHSREPPPGERTLSSVSARTTDLQLGPSWPTNFGLFSLGLWILSPSRRYAVHGLTTSSPRS
ncbi:hypothetical protein Cob_v004623 [Colletotrichum orbiculare MAFF 240422]|uniref:Uncharacterized protein n=1 Tax=Colletotrichum orbiculare (strain 104-T / ATCC 96160 / CBS 514.97 / LARS 414 / MAFF 240422) TaxID=1213857 RepID=A0A484FXF4_COLOR|nr:hypothetical protein Cob_v004623 [Colletotrichum orbiculare MAFF 240422]